MPDLCVSALLVLLALLGLCWAGDVPSYLGLTLYLEQYLSTFLGLRSRPPSCRFAPTRARGRTGFLGNDILLAAVAICCAGYVAILYPDLATDLSATTTDRLAISGAGLLLILEATRRMFGWVL